MTSASLAQLVNVIAPIMTEPNGPAWRQTTFFPFALTSRLAQGVALEVKLESETYSTAVYGDVAVVDAVATHDEETGLTSVFLVNRDQTRAVSVEIDTTALGDVTVREAQTLSDADVYARNVLDDQERVGLRANDSVRVSRDVVSITLPPVSWTAISLAIGVDDLD